MEGCILRYQVERVDPIIRVWQFLMHASLVLFCSFRITIRFMLYFRTSSADTPASELESDQSDRVCSGQTLLELDKSNFVASLLNQ